MTATTIRVQMAQRKDTAANWTAANPILLSGEIGYETDTKKFKIGNGSTNWNSLAYLPIPDGSGNLTITGNLEIGSTGSLTFEGSTADGFETTLAVTNPTADRTITLPDRSGTVITSGDTGTVTSTMILDGTIVNDDVNASAAIAGTKISPNFGAQTITTTGVVSAAVGAAATPSITFTGDSNTGIYSPGADQVAISTGGSGRLFVDSNGDVTVGHSSSSYSAAGRGLVAVNGSSSSLLDLQTGTTSRFRMFCNGTTTELVNSEATGNLVFGTNNTERLRITSTGQLSHIGAGSSGSPAVSFSGSAASNSLVVDSSSRVGIGTSSPATNFHIGSGTGGNDLGLLLSRGATTNFFEAHDGTKNFIAGTDSSNAFVKAGSLTNDPVAIVQSNAAAIYIDTSKRVGIGTTSPIATLHVDGTGVQYIRTSSSTYSNFVQTFAGNGSTGVEYKSVYRFVDTDNGERARINSSGRLLVGTSTARTQYGVTAQTQVEGTSNDTASISIISNASAGGGANLLLGRSKGGSIGSNTTVASGDILGSIFFNGANGSNLANCGASVEAVVDGTVSGGGAGDLPTRLVFSTTADGASSPTERLRITSTGQVRLDGAGITFNGDTATANELDDYEEGTWTPSVGGTATYSDQTGFYTKVGRTVIASFKFQITNLGTGSAFNVSGIPFATSDVGRGGVYFYYWAGLAQNTVTLAGLLGTTSFDINGQDLAAAGIDYQKPVLGDGARVDGMLVYQVV